MKINYKFANGEKTTVEIEVSKEIEDFIVLSNRYEDNLKLKNRRHCYSLDQGKEMGCQYSVPSNIEELFEEPAMEEKLLMAISKLRPKQQELIKAIYFDGVSVKDYAKKEGVNPASISHRLIRAKNFLKKFL